MWQLTVRAVHDSYLSNPENSTAIMLHAKCKYFIFNVLVRDTGCYTGVRNL